MRGKAAAMKPPVTAAGITPAHAGKSIFQHTPFLQVWDHPRACGEKGMLRLKHSHKLGSPPRMRGKAGGLVYVHKVAGITPAHAGKRPTL